MGLKLNSRGNEVSERTVTRESSNRQGGRLTFLDWSRGLAVVVMLQGHVFHSFGRQDLRNDGPFVLSQFFGGIWPPVFLVLTRITLAFPIDCPGKPSLWPLARWAPALLRAR